MDESEKADLVKLLTLHTHEIDDLKHQVLALKVITSSLIFIANERDPGLLDRLSPALLGFAEKKATAGSSQFTKAVEEVLSMSERLAQSLAGERKSGR